MGLWSPFIAPDCWFFSSFKICSLASSWEDGERPRFCTSRRGGTCGRSRDGGEIRADWGNGCLMFLNIFENVKKCYIYLKKTEYMVMRDNDAGVRDGQTWNVRMQMGEDVRDPGNR